MADTLETAEPAVQQDPIETADREPAAPAPEGAPDGAPAAGEAAKPDTGITIPIRYNHQDRTLTLEQAQALAQKGLKFDELAPVLDRLKTLAAAGGKSVPELVDSLAEEHRQRLYQSLLEECGGNEALAGRLLEAEKLRQQALFADKQAADKDALLRRLADEFVGLQKEFPQLTRFGDLPRTVVEMAAGGMPLLDAYLRHQHSEHKKVAAAREAAQRAAQASAGSQAAGAGETANPTIEALLAGIWG